jgi:hypothetical protein
MRLSSLVAATLLLVGTAAAASAQTDGCAGFKWSVEREKQAFAAQPPTIASGAAYAPGAAAAVTLSPQDQVAYSVKPRRAPKSTPAYGAELTSLVTQAGTYQATLSEDAWIDLVQGGKVLRSSGFSGKTGCPGLRKSLRFQLQTGPLTVTISDSPASTVKLDILPVE